VECRVGLLRHIEALRLHAAEHQAQFPRALEDSGVPLPRDPITGKPFVYKLENSAALLKTPMTSPAREQTDPAFAASFEITIRK
jgi:hypothetical protein